MMVHICARRIHFTRYIFTMDVLRDILDNIIGDPALWSSFSLT